MIALSTDPSQDTVCLHVQVYEGTVPLANSSRKTLTEWSLTIHLNVRRKKYRRGIQMRGGLSATYVYAVDVHCSSSEQQRVTVSKAKGRHPDAEYVLTIWVIKVDPSPDTTVQQTPLNVVGLWVPHAQPLVILHSQGNMLSRLVGYQILLQLVIEAGVGIGQLHKLLEMPHCSTHSCIA